MPERAPDADRKGKADKFYKSPMIKRDDSDPRNKRSYTGKSVEGNRILFMGNSFAVYDNNAAAIAAAKRCLKKVAS